MSEQGALLLKKQLKGMRSFSIFSRNCGCFCSINCANAMLIRWRRFLSPELSRNPTEGFSAGLIDDDNLFKWELMVVGPPDTF